MTVQEVADKYLYYEVCGYSKLTKKNKDDIRNAFVNGALWAQKQLIDRLENWLANNICNAYNFRGDNISATIINDCIKAMKGE